MSGGSYDYLYAKVQEMARTLVGQTPQRAAFATFLLGVADAMHDIEWVDSGDYGPGQENAAIERCLTGTAISSTALGALERLRDSLTALLEAESERAKILGDRP